MRKMAKSLALLLVLMLALSGCKGTKAPEKVLIKENVYTFSDGVQVSTWRYLEDGIPTYENGSEGESTAVRFEMDSKLIYQLDDGTELLATRTAGLERSTPESQKLLYELSPTASDSILAFYQELGTMYELEGYLEQAYAEHQENPKEFRCYLLTQESEITAADDAAITCTTTVKLPVGQGEYEMHSVEHSFDRETGTLVEN